MVKRSFAARNPNTSLLVPALISCLLSLPACGAPSSQEKEEVARMLAEIARDTRETAGTTGRNQLADRVLGAMARVPRDRFVPTSQRGRAYFNRPLPIGSGQTISQPFIVALMTDLAGVKKGDRVLEIGTGSGYQAAVLAELGVEVFSIEIIPELAARARSTLDETGYGRIRTRVGDGYHGWPEEAPFDAIVVTAAAPEIPQPLLDQLTDGGRLVIPVASGSYGEQLTLVTRRGGDHERRELLPVRFVPLTGNR